MRNGNSISTIMYANASDSSYRTYEEWKHQWAEGERLTKISSYRTYEEWKHVSNLILNPSFFCVLTVPMRNGNLAAYRRAITQGDSSYRTYEEWKLTCSTVVYSRNLVLTVPMRNGNSVTC